MTLVFDGNTGHSTGWWWRQASAFYVGSTLQYNKDTNLLEYDPGRSKTFFRNTCTVNPCFILKKDCGRCTNDNRGWLRFTNIKSFLSAGIGFVSIIKTTATMCNCRSYEKLSHGNLQIVVYDVV